MDVGWFGLGVATGMVLGPFVVIAAIWLLQRLGRVSNA